MVETELSSPPPLKPSHCVSPPLHNSPFVSSLLVVCFSTTPFGSGDGSVSVTKSRGQSEVKAPSSLLTSESLAWPSQLLQTPTQQKGVVGLAQGERAAKGKEKDMLSQMRFVWKVPSWQHGWLLHLDIMGPLIYSVPVLLCDCGHFIARSINRGIHHRLHHHHPCQYHMIAWWCFPSLLSVIPKKTMVI